MKTLKPIIMFLFAVLFLRPAFAEPAQGAPSAPIIDETIFSDKLLIDGYAAKIKEAPKDVLLAMINDSTLQAYRKAASVRVFRERFAFQIVAKEKTIIERFLLRQLERVESPYVQIEIMHALLVMDRYRYFDSMVPALIQKIDHYEKDVADLAYQSVVDINEIGTQRSREARIEFNTLRKMFFLTRKKLITDYQGDPRLKDKLELLRWAVKVLGTQELKNLPQEVLGLM